MKGVMFVTGRDLIVYILQHNLEDEPVFKDGKFIGFMTVGEAAEMMMVGTATVRTWAELGMIDAIRPVDNVYIPVTCKSVLGKDLDM